MFSVNYMLVNKEYLRSTITTLKFIYRLINLTVVVVVDVEVLVVVTDVAVVAVIVVVDVIVPKHFEVYITISINYIDFKSNND